MINPFNIPDDPRITEIETWGYPREYASRFAELEEDEYSGDPEYERAMNEADRRWSER